MLTIHTSTNRLFCILVDSIIEIPPTQLTYVIANSTERKLLISASCASSFAILILNICLWKENFQDEILSYSSCSLFVSRREMLELISLSFMRKHGMAKASLWSEHELHIYKSTLGPLTSIITQYTIGEAPATDMAEAVEWATRPLGLVEVFLWVKLFNINLRWEWLMNKLRCGIRASADDDVSEKKIKMGPASNDSNCKFLV